jgi:hypothetical protein
MLLLLLMLVVVLVVVLLVLRRPQRVVVVDGGGGWPEGRRPPRVRLVLVQQRQRRCNVRRLVQSVPTALHLQPSPNLLKKLAMQQKIKKYLVNDKNLANDPHNLVKLR